MTDYMKTPHGAFPIPDHLSLAHLTDMEVIQRELACERKHNLLDPFCIDELVKRDLLRPGEKNLDKAIERAENRERAKKARARTRRTTK